MAGRADDRALRLRATRLSLAQSLLDSGDFADALPVYEQVIAEARAAGELLREAVAGTFAAIRNAANAPALLLDLRGRQAIEDHGRML